METITFAEKIEQKIQALSSARDKLPERIKTRAESLANYDKMIALIIMKLRNGVEFEFEGQKIINPQTTIIEKVAKGICWREKLAMEEADTLYRSSLSQIEIIKAQLNGYQSINRHLESN